MALSMHKAHFYLDWNYLIQFGGKKHHQAADIILCIRVIIQKMHEWHRPLFLATANIRGAFDNIHPKAVMDMLENRHVEEDIQLAILQELVDTDSPRYAKPIFEGTHGSWEEMLKGLIQGSVEAMKLFVAIIADMLLRLQTKWEREGKGVFFGTHDGSNLAFNKFYDLYFDHSWFNDPSTLYASILGCKNSE